MSNIIEKSNRLRILCFDTETTGLPKPKRVPLSHQPKIIEVGLVVYECNSTLTSTMKLKTYSQIIDPKETISAEITKITGLTNADLVGKPTFAEILPKLSEMFEGVNILVAHNANFDVTMLANELNRLGADVNKAFPWPPQIVCSVQEYQHKFGFRPNLQKLYELIMEKPLEQTHRALDDANALAEILIKDRFAERFV